MEPHQRQTYHVNVKSGPYVLIRDRPVIPNIRIPANTFLQILIGPHVPWGLRFVMWRNAIKMVVFFINIMKLDVEIVIVKD